jgi:hypothetical protein
MWVIRAGDQDRLVPRFVDQGVIGVGFGHVPDAEILTRTEIRRFLTDGQSTAALDAQEAAMSAFVRELQVGDSVLMPDPLCDEVVVGTVTGRYQFDDDATDPEFRHHRTVDWLARHPITDLPAAVRGTARQKPLLAQHRDAEWSAYLAQVRDGTIGRDPQDRPAPTLRTATRRRPSSPASTRVVKPVIAQRTCQACFLQTHPDRMRGDYCVDCAE